MRPSPAPQTSFAMAAEREVEVAILGAGMSGLCMAIQLQRAGVHGFVLIENPDARECRVTTGYHDFSV